MRWAGPPLLAVLLVALSGCLVFGGPGVSTMPPTNESCVTDAVPDPGTLDPSGNVTPAPYPDPPDVVHGSAVRSFAVAFERAHVTNDMLARNEDGDLDRLLLGSRKEALQSHSDGYAVSFTISIASYYADGGHGDGSLTVEYFLNETTIRRSHEDGVDARDGTVLVRCA